MPATNHDPIYPAKRLEDFISGVLAALGLPEGDARTCAARMTEADGKIKLAAQKGESIPEGWMVDRKGRPLTDPRRSAEGFLLPIGGYKGYGLNVVIGMLAGVLNGAPFGRDVVDFNAAPGTPNRGGHVVMAMRVDNFRPVEEFKREMDRVIREIRESERMEGVERIWLPGEMEYERVRERRKQGIPVASSTVQQLRQLAVELKLPDQLD